MTKRHHAASAIYHPLHHISRRSPAASQVREAHKWLVISFYWVLWGRQRSAVLNGISPKQSSNHKKWLSVPAYQEAAPIAAGCPQAFLHCSYGHLLQLSQWAASKTVTGNRLDSFKLNRQMPNRPVTNMDHIQSLELNSFSLLIGTFFFSPSI